MIKFSRDFRNSSVIVVLGASDDVNFQAWHFSSVFCRSLGPVAAVYDGDPVVLAGQVQRNCGELLGCPAGQEEDVVFCLVQLHKFQEVGLGFRVELLVKG